MSVISAGGSRSKKLPRLQTIELFALTCVVFVSSFSEAVLFNAHREPSTSDILISRQDQEMMSHDRWKRSSADATAAAAEISPMATNVHLNNSHLHLMVHWAGQDSRVVFCLGRDQVAILIYTSLNSGDLSTDHMNTGII